MREILLESENMLPQAFVRLDPLAMAPRLRLFDALLQEHLPALHKSDSASVVVHALTHVLSCWAQ